jgi:hypothetical protein
MMLKHHFGLVWSAIARSTLVEQNIHIESKTNEVVNCLVSGDRGICGLG